MSIRRFLLVPILAAGMLVTTSASLAQTTDVPIKHVVVMMQDNHSFDNYFGTYPGADGIDPAACVPINPTDPEATSCIRPFPIDGRTIEPLNFNRRAFDRQYRNGQMDGFIQAFRLAGKEGTLALGYYDERDLPFYWNLADNYVLFDRFFSAAANGGVVNRMFWVAGVAGNPENRIPEVGWGDIPTIFDRLQERGVSWKVYVQNYDAAMTVRALPAGDDGVQVVRMPLLAFPRFLDQPELRDHIVDLDQYTADISSGKLPAVAYIVASGASERPPGDLQNGQRLVRNLLNQLMRSDAWSSSAFFLTYDDTGGWYDHVLPPRVDGDGYGFRVPTLLVSPYARKGYIDSTTLDITAVLKFIEDLHDLPPTSARSASANSLLGAFDFTQPPRAPVFISFEREIKTKVEPRRDVIYMSYGGAMIVAGLIIAGAAMVARRGEAQAAGREASS